eukprot:2203034-Pleurochrysis_carterae.AAC.1
MPTFTGATATAARPAVATRKGGAHTSRAVTGTANASKSAVRAAAVSGECAAASVACAAKPNM